MSLPKTNSIAKKMNSVASRKILVIGQTPPPFHGQAMMTERLVNAELEGVELFLVRTSFSKSIKEVGKFSMGKVFHMLEVIFAAISQKLKHKIPFLYYMPAGNGNTPLLRDIFMLLILRLFFSKTIFHFRAAGIGQFVDNCPWILKGLAKIAYHRPNLAIHLADTNPDDGGYFKAKDTVVIPNGLEDSAARHLPIQRPQRKKIKILFVGVVKKSKGVEVLLEASNALLKKGLNIETVIVGGPHDQKSYQEMLDYCEREGISDSIKFVGVKKGEDKWKYFLDADIFCFPSFFESESFGNVLVEAMMFELPLIATEWRGIPSIVKQSENGLLVPIQNPPRTADALELLVNDEELRHRMGKRGREMFKKHYRLSTFITNINDALRNA